MTDGEVIRCMYARTDVPLTSAMRERITALLPSEEVERIGRYRLPHDRHARWWGMALVEAGLASIKGGHTLAHWRRDPYGRPSVGEGVDFNLSHSGEYVVAAFRVGGRVGIDIEKVTPVPLDDFRGQFSDDEWRHIKEAPDRLRPFYKGWTAKEAAVKGDGRGLSLPLAEVALLDDGVRVDGSLWRIARIDVDPGYETCVAAPCERMIVEASPSMLTA